LRNADLEVRELIERTQVVVVEAQNLIGELDDMGRRVWLRRKKTRAILGATAGRLGTLQHTAAVWRAAVTGA